MKKIYNYKKIFVVPALLALTVLPLSASALGVGIDGTTKTGFKLDGNRVESRQEVNAKAEDRDDDRDEKSKSDLRKDRGTTSTSTGDMRLPKGIEKRIEDGKSIPYGIWKKIGERFDSWFNWFSKHDLKTDVTSPIIKSIKVNDVASTSAVVVWTTDERANGNLWYSTSTIDINATSSVSLNDYKRLHTVKLDNLSASTTYKYVVKSSDKAGNVVVSGQGEFTTK